ncbi:thioesterase family protein-like protein [Pseudovirgaria hyperparasitica]|uniref:Thioesterase family protein-like protein n=1 Tax=Pseudovirgaria hyperparasitica TaxID=470096 RepID=A0A6A6VZB4_9PEZI|nr:thioesterase family protein-like protein [Pseudovirgaria hyperparasitica]KAF2755992.1 thioesterase family protein-like protein [Pseudovirgaria hyperparasitica]
MASEHTAARAKVMRAVNAMFERYHLIAAKLPKKRIEWDDEVMRNAKLIDASPSGHVVFHIDITPHFANINGVLHGGAASTIFDMLTTSALCPLARPGQFTFLGGVTRTLNVSFLRAVPIGTTVRVEATVTQMGRTMAMMRGTMGSVNGKTVYATAEHHKVNVPTREAHSAVRVAWDEEFERDSGIGGRAKL